MRNGLYLHAGANAATLDEVKAVVTPEASYRGAKRKFLHQPIPHVALYDAVVNNLRSGGLSIVNEAHALTRGGERYFGTLGVKNGHEAEDYGLVIGIRNGHGGDFKAGLALGASVFVCDNLSFSGEVVVGRAHTRNILRDLNGVVNSAIAKLVDYRRVQDTRFIQYKATEIGDRDAHSIILRSLLGGVIGENRVRPVLDEWTKPRHEEFSGRTVWSLYNAFTEILKPQGENAPTTLTTLSTRTQKLHGILDTFSGVVANLS